MLPARLRLVFLIATFLISLNVAAATRLWTLTGVQFSDGAIATGHFGYDDLTNEIADWNIRVTPGPSTAPFDSYTYVPGNTNAVRLSSGHFAFTSDFAFLADSFRTLLMPWIGPFDGSSVIVPLGRNGGLEYRTRDLAGDMSRAITAGSLVLATSLPPIVTVRVEEFYNETLDHWFMTADASEKDQLDKVRSGWFRTGEFFTAYAAGSPAGGPINPVCRSYGNPQAGLDSHFYSADHSECAELYWKYGRSVWTFESDNAFQIHLPDKVTGTCPEGTIPVYRLWNSRTDSNHRYTTIAETKDRFRAAGFHSEGYGPEGVAMCALHW